ncbi:MAG: BMP family ABC transporter substrate-binding protein, partial [Treponema sp.]|nr:BMP family ABC transporter substrate-binding protein [Treponema sp.]
MKLKYLFFLLIGLLLFSGCKKSDQSETGNGGFSIAVFIPGVMAGSAIYEMLAEGTIKAAEDFAASNHNRFPKVTVIEGGFNQAEWESQVTTLAASGNYDLIVSSNPSLPVIVSAVSEKFPEQKFLLLDGELD